MRRATANPCCSLKCEKRNHNVSKCVIKSCPNICFARSILHIIEFDEIKRILEDAIALHVKCPSSM